MVLSLPSPSIIIFLLLGISTFFNHFAQPEGSEIISPLFEESITA